MPIDVDSLDLPAKAGVYLFKDPKGRVLYVGKATKLNQRIRSYFAKNPDRAMIPELVAKSSEVDFIITPNPTQALILERQLIRQHKPRYNSLLKDDKSFPFIALSKHEFPRIMYTRHPPKGSDVWGPFANAGAAKQVIQLIRKNFGIRDCKELLPQGCLSMHIGLCSGPCIDGTGYKESVNAVKNILNGDADKLISELAEKMDDFSQSMHFEAAAKQRDLIKSVRSTISQNVISSKLYRECDAIGFDSRGEVAAIAVIHADDGIVKGQEVWQMVHKQDTFETIAAFISDYYTSNKPPKLILSPTNISDEIQEWLNERRGSSVEVRIPQRGDLVKLRKLADQNATVKVARFAMKSSGSIEQKAADEAAAVLGLESLDNLVCMDMAQFLGQERVGASVLFRNGRPDKKGYRTYTIKGEAMDDLRMMAEIVERWAKKQEEWPDLLLLDGGQTHLDMIKLKLKELGLWKRFPVAAIAKQEETLFREGHEPFVMDKRCRVLIHSRDEAHRFVNTFHRKRRAKSTLKDPLDSVPGLGAKKMQALIRYFGGRKGIEAASLHDLQTIDGVGPALATRIHEALHGVTDE
jgi:excinuclease ABC subunit C